MKTRTDRRLGRAWFAGILALIMWCLAGCAGGEGETEKIRDLEFTVLGADQVPPDLASAIAQKGTEPFKITMTDDQGLYIAVGYGRQETGGYSIQVTQLYLTDNAVVIDTQLLGPENGEEQAGETSPYLVVKTEYSENPVVFQ